MSGIERLKRLKVIAFEVDGIFTDGHSWQDTAGRWRRTFSVRDSIGIRALRKAGYKIAIITTAQSDEIALHAASLGVDFFHEGVADKKPVLDWIKRSQSITSDEIGFMSSQEEDLEIMQTIGFAITVPSASAKVVRNSRFVTSRDGGDGAILELSNLILQHASRERRMDSPFDRSNDVNGVTT